jgi:acetyl-CoA acyltransferase
MGLTAEAVAQQFKVSREDQDEFAYHSHMKALKAQEVNLTNKLFLSL